MHDGGLDVDVRLAEDGVLFNFLNVGGGGAAVLGLPANDTYRSISSVPIRTTGEKFTQENFTSKLEDGIGMSPNELLTFDLDELRTAGRLPGIAMRFVVERAGINDADIAQPSYYKDKACANLLVIVSTEERALSAYVNGTEVFLSKRNGVFSVDTEMEELASSLRADGRFVAFDVPIPPHARYLTLVTTDYDGANFDHAVFSGARLELAASVE
ncbi:hypothetical protein Pan181_35720 [Aeoliella mucimassa]|uniref:Uncharacterized protein n=1 Tax=Aeoliella mucimassa TaxID=2527972 RepID=A0A518ARL0_9BACT|nr:hypothetical protein Pan181_35720 [Aeoliella mucimassa]